MTNEIFRCSLEPSGDGREYSVCPKCGKKRYTRFVDIRLDSICLMSLVVARELTAVAIWRALRIILTK